jgi:cell division protein FtsW (lipid II flippase)
MNVTARRVAGWVGIVLLIAVSLLGLQSAVGQLSDAATTGQWTYTWTQWAYGVAGIVAAAALLMRRSWHRPVLWIWVVFITITGGLAPVVWGGSPPMVGLAAGLASAAIAGVVILLVHQMPREQRGAP